MGRISPPPKDLNSFLGRKWLESLARESIATAFSVANSDGSLTISPTTGAVFASINLNHANIWLADQSVPDEAYGVAWNGSVEVPTKNALYDKIELVVAAIPSAYTNEQAQDAIGAMIDATLSYVDGTPLLSINLSNANTWAAQQKNTSYFRNNSAIDYYGGGGGANDVIVAAAGQNATSGWIGLLYDSSTLTLNAQTEDDSLVPFKAQTVIASSFSGTWNGDAIGLGYGGTNQTSYGANRVPYINAANTSFDSSSTFTFSGTNLGVGIATGSARIHSLATTEQLRLGYDSSNYVTSTVDSSGNLALQTTAGATAGVYTLTPHGAGGDGTNRTLSFGRAWGNAALYLYNNGATARFGWGMRADCMQFFAPTTTGGLYTWNRGGDLQATGTNEIMRLVQYTSGTGAGLGMGRGAFGGTTPYRIDLEGVSATIGTAGVENIIRFSRPISGGVSYPEAFAMGLGRYSSSGFGPDTRVDFLLKSTANSDIVPNALVMSLQSNLKLMLYGEIEIDGDLNHDGTNVGFYAVAPVARATVAGAAAAFVANTSAIADDSATFDGFTIGQVVKALRNIGILT